MKKKLSIIITALILSILAAGCSVEIHEDSGKQDAKYYLYDISSDETQLQKESYSPEETTADYMLKDMMQRMNSQQTDSQNRVSLLPEGVQMNYSVEEDVLVVAGRGVRNEKDVEMCRELAEALGGQLAFTRPMVENGFGDTAHQIGLSGRTVRPKLIITCGVSGAIQFTSCMNGSECIVAINTDPQAQIFGVADYCIVDDLYQVVPELTALAKKQKED